MVSPVLSVEEIGYCTVASQGVGVGGGGGLQTLLRSSPPCGCSGVLHSDEFLALSLLLLGSLSLMMSYCRQNRTITPERERREWFGKIGKWAVRENSETFLCRYNVLRVSVMYTAYRMPYILGMS